jgi:hypothetical protein
MNTNQNNYISKIIAPIILGAAVSFLFRLGLFIFLSQIVSNKWEPSYLTVVLVALILPVVSGSFFTTFFFAQTKFIHGLISSIVFAAVVIFPSITMFSIELGDSRDLYKIWLLSICLTLIAGILGAYFGISLKKRRKIN